MAANVPENWLLGISPEGIGTVGMLLNFVVAFVVSSFTVNRLRKFKKWLKT